MSRGEIIAGMARQLWATVTGAKYVGQPPRLAKRPVPPGATLAAKELAKLYEAANGVSLAEIQKRSDAARPRGRTPRVATPPDMFGEMLASYALNTVSYYGDDALSLWNQAGLKTPEFSIRLVGDDLTWEGAEVDRRPIVMMEIETPSCGPGRRSHRNPVTRVQWYRISWPGKKGERETGVYPADGIDAHVRFLVASGVKEHDISLMPDGYEERHSNPPRFPHEVPHTKTVAETRAILSRIPVSERCDDNCPGWIVAEVDREPGEEIEVCDECMTSLPKAIRLSDDDVAQLPEAKKALAAHGSELVSNPRRKSKARVGQ